MAEIHGTKQVEDAAIAWLIRLEQAAGRSPVDTRHLRSAPADLSSPPRIIEVKAAGTSARGQDLWLEPTQFEEAQRNPNFWIYIVDNVRQGDPAKFRLRALGGARLRRLLQRAREQRYFTVPVPVADYDQAPAELLSGEATSP